MACCSKALLSSSRPFVSFFSSSSASPSSDSVSFAYSNSNGAKFNSSSRYPLTSEKKTQITPFLPSFPSPKSICKAAEYKFPDPIPEFADAETEKFRTHLLKKLSKKNMYGDSLDEVVETCTEILSTFLQTEYGGPGTLLVIPFIDMADTLNERGLPGGPQAARAAVKWAEKHVDKDWKEWTSSS